MANLFHKLNPKFWFFLIFIAGIFLRIYKLGHQSLWNDEIYSVYIAKSSVLEILTVSFWRNTHQPLYYLLLHFFTFFGNSEFLIRLPSLLFGIGTIYVFYLILKNWIGEKYSYYGVLIFSFSSFHVWYSQEARPYMMMLFFGLLAFYFLQKLIHSPKSKFRFGFILSAAAAYYCQSITLAFFLVLFIQTILYINWKDWKYWFLTYFYVFLLISPTFIGLIFNSPSYSADPYREVNISQIMYIFWAFATGYSIGPSLVELHFLNFKSVLNNYLVLIAPIAIFFAGLLLNAFYKLWIEYRKIFISILSWLLVPICFIILGALVSNHAINVRYVIFSFPAFVCLLAIGIKELNIKFFPPIALTIIIVVNILSLFNYFGKPKYQRENTRAAAYYLLENATTNDLIIASAPYTKRNLEYYYKQNVEIVGYPFQKYNFVDKNDVESDIEKITSRKNRFWLFLSRTYHSDPNGLIKKMCDTQYRRLKSASWNGVELFLYEKL